MSYNILRYTRIISNIKAWSLIYLQSFLKLELLKKFKKSFCAVYLNWCSSVNGAGLQQSRFALNKVPSGMLMPGSASVLSEPHVTHETEVGRQQRNRETGNLEPVSGSVQHTLSSLYADVRTLLIF